MGGFGIPADREPVLAPNALATADFEGKDAPAAGNESYEPIFENDFIVPQGEQALSTFSIDVDTASYSNVRRFLEHGQRPPADAVRIEELVNYFHYDYAPPKNGDPFAVHTEVAACPWNPEHRLVRFGLKGREITKDQRPLSNLVFLIDVSGSMSAKNKLPLVQKALTMLTNEMNENDRISIVTYAGNAGVKLPSTSGEHRSDILSAVNNLTRGRIDQRRSRHPSGLHRSHPQLHRRRLEPRDPLHGRRFQRGRQRRRRTGQPHPGQSQTEPGVFEHLRLRHGEL